MKLNEYIKKENPFKVPDGYFDSLAERTMEAISGEESRNGAREVHGEGVLPGTVQMKVHPGDKSTGGSTPGKSRIISMKPFLSLAAAILGFAVIAAVTVRLLTSDRHAEGYEPGTSLYADLAFEELDAYMLEHELFVTEPVTGVLPEEEISSEAIIEFLMTEDIDLNDIYELL